MASTPRVMGIPAVSTISPNPNAPTMAPALPTAAIRKLGARLSQEQYRGLKACGPLNRPTSTAQHQQAAVDS